MLAVTGGKGGVGKTTMTLALAAASSRRGERPVAVDADLDLPDLAAVAGLDEHALGAVAGGRDVETLPRRAGVRVLGTTPDTEPGTLRRALDRLTGLDRPVFVDCPAGAGRVHGLALRAATRSVLVTTPRRRAVEDAVKAGALARRLDAQISAVVVNESASVPELPFPDDWPDPVAVPAVADRPAWRYVSVPPAGYDNGSGVVETPHAG